MDQALASDLEFLAGGGEMGAHIRAKDWRSTPLGPPDDWPPELRLVIRIMLTTNHPIFIFWGPELRCFYNDAYSHSIGPERHPVSLGEKGREVWDEIWDEIGPQIDFVMAGKGATWHRDQLIPITRHGRKEDVYWTYSYSPIDDPSAPHGVGGVLVICTETTQRVVMEQTLEEQLLSRDMLLREVNHRIKNSLQLVSALLSIEGSAAKSEETRTSLARASARVHAISSIHELIHRSKDIQSVKIDRYLQDLCGEIAGSAVSQSRKVEVSCHAETFELPTDVTVTIALLVNEFVTNSLKHAFPDERAGRVEVSMKRHDGHAILQVSDNGVGKPIDASGNLGTRIIAGLVRQISGKLTETTDALGYSARIAFPLPE